MLISTRSRYGIRALTQLAKRDNVEPVSLSSIAESELIPIRYLEQIFGKLRSAGIVCGRRGPGGGYVLCRPPTEITLFDVVSALEKDFLPVDCLQESSECVGRREPGSKQCVLQDQCLTRVLWITMRTGYRNYLSSHTIEDLIMRRLSPVNIEPVT